MDGLEMMLARFLGAHGKVMPKTSEEVEAMLSELHEDHYDEGVREGLAHARNSIPTDIVESAAKCGVSLVA